MEKTTLFLPTSSHPRGHTAEHHVTTAQLEKVPLLGKGRAGGATSLPSLLGHDMKDPLGIPPLRDWHQAGDWR